MILFVCSFTHTFYIAFCQLLPHQAFISFHSTHILFEGFIICYVCVVFRLFKVVCLVSVLQNVSYHTQYSQLRQGIYFYQHLFKTTAKLVYNVFKLDQILKEKCFILTLYYDCLLLNVSARTHKSCARTCKSSDRMYKSSDRAHQSIDRTHQSYDRVHKSSDRMHKSSDRTHKSSDRMQQ